MQKLSKDLIKGFLESCVVSVSWRGRFFALLNLLFFGCVFVVALLAQFLFPPPLYLGWSPRCPEIFLGSGFSMFLGVFVFNLVISAFAVVTLLGVVFFPWSTFFLLFRGVLWGLLLYPLPVWLFLAVLPTFVLEGEAYVLAALAGSLAGFSWIKPAYVYRGEALSRFEALKKSLEECLRIYVFVAMLLFIAAVVETGTMISC